MFRRWRAKGEAIGALEAMGGQSAYRAPVRINGRSGRLTVLGFDASLPGIHRAMRQRFGLKARPSPGATMSIDRVATDHGALDLVAVELELGRTAVFAIERGADTGDAAPPHPPIRELPAFPGSRATLSLADERAKLQFAMLATEATPRAVHHFYREELGAAGWARAPAPDDSPLALFLKPRALCAVYADGPRFALMHKTLQD